jgi:hypothetical protein
MGMEIDGLRLDGKPGHLSDDEVVPLQPNDPVTVEEKPTPLFSLKARRQEIADKLYVDIRIPRWEDPEIWVRYKPVTAKAFADAINERSSKGGSDWSFLANIDMLVVHCMGVYGREDTGEVDEDEEPIYRKFSLKEGSPDGPWTKFDLDLSDALGLGIDHKGGQAATCRGTFFTEGDIIATVNYLLRWSNIANDEADANFVMP